MNDEIELTNNRNKFILAIITSLQIEMDDFMERVANEECYESLIYNWGIRLFEKGTTTIYAIKVIHRARRFVLITKSSNNYVKTLDLTLEKTLIMLKEHPKYQKLDTESKLIVQKKVAELFNNNARMEAIEEVLEQMNPNVFVDKQKNQVAFIKVTANRIMNAIRKWNLNDYWRNKRKKKPQN